MQLGQLCVGSKQVEGGSGVSSPKFFFEILYKKLCIVVHFYGLEQLDSGVLHFEQDAQHLL
jgi:hypothetical protein